MNNLKTRNGLRIAGVLTLVTGLAFTAACKKSTPPVSAPEKAVELPMPSSRQNEPPTAPVQTGRDAEMDRVLEKMYPGDPAKQEVMRKGMAALDAQGDAEKRQAEINRRTMVTPAPAGFKPEPVARKIRLKLILEKKQIRVGEYPRFRLEMTNVGRKAIDYQEFQRSIFASGAGYSDSSRTITFYLTDSIGKRKEMMPLFGIRSPGAPSSHRTTPFASGMTEAEKEKQFQEISSMAAGSGSNFEVKLLPGETLHSLGDVDSPAENFKPLLAKGFKYGEPGIYRLHVELDDRPGPLDKDDIERRLSYRTLEEIHEQHEKEVRDALGPVSSNAVPFEITQ